MVSESPRALLCIDHIVVLLHPQLRRGYLSQPLSIASTSFSPSNPLRITASPLPISNLDALFEMQPYPVTAPKRNILVGLIFG